MRILMVCEQAPGRDPLHGGGASLISGEILHHLPDNVKVDLVYFSNDDNPLPDDLQQRPETVVRVTPRGGRVALSFVLSRYSRAAWRLSGRGARDLIFDMSAKADVTVLHGPQVLGLASAVQGPLVVQEIDPWSEFMHQQAETLRLPKRMLMRLMAARMRQLELHAAKRAHAFIVVNQDDAKRHAVLLRRTVIAIPNGIDPVEQVFNHGPHTRTVGFVGTLDYAPNTHAAKRLVQVVETLRNDLPDVNLLIAGRRPPPDLRDLIVSRSWIRLVPNFDRLRDVLREIDVYACPEQEGFGTRNSPLEALRFGVPVVSFASGARGLPSQPHLRIVENESAFVRALVHWLDPLTNDAVRPSEQGLGEPWDAVTSTYLRAYSDAASAAD